MAKVSFAQWTNTYTTPSVNYYSVSGWLDFEKSGSTWKKRLYYIDSNKVQIMASGYNFTPQYTYNFNAAEKMAGGSVYSLSVDLNNDGRTEFYILGYYGTSTSYRQSFKIIDLVTGNVLFEKNDANYSYAYPVLADVNGDGLLECLVTKYPYPALSTYTIEVYSTGVSGVADKNIPASFKLMQNYPNPFNPSTTISFSLSRVEDVQLRIYNIQGKLIKTLLHKSAPVGTTNIEWDGADEYGIKQTSGVYFYELRGDSFTETRKMILLK